MEYPNRDIQEVPETLFRRIFMEKAEFKPNGRALLPFLIFVVSYLGIGITLVAKGDPMGFYGFKGPIAVIIGIIAAFLLHKGSIDEKFDSLVRGCGDSNIITILRLIWG